MKWKYKRELYKARARAKKAGDVAEYNRFANAIAYLNNEDKQRRKNKPKLDYDEQEQGQTSTPAS